MIKHLLECRKKKLLDSRYLALVSSEFIVTVALVVVDTLALARANEVREIGCDTKAMSDGAIQSHPSVITLALISSNTGTMTRANA